MLNNTMSEETRGGTKASPARIRARKREEKAVELRLRGKTFQEIADELKYASRASAYNAVMTAIKISMREPTLELVEITLQRLDRLADAAWDKAMSGDVQAIVAVLRVEKQRADLLGLNAPKELDITLEAAEIAAKEGLDPDDVVKAAQDYIREHAK